MFTAVRNRESPNRTDPRDLPLPFTEPRLSKLTPAIKQKVTLTRHRTFKHPAYLDIGLQDSE